MSSNKPTPYSQREQGYREKALKMYPWVCGRCAREFSGKRLSELTVHHKDHNHDNNPEDGSNGSCCASIVTTTSIPAIPTTSTRPKPGPAVT